MNFGAGTKKEYGPARIGIERGAPFIEPST
jgi:hypothetical protein